MAQSSGASPDDISDLQAIQICVFLTPGDCGRLRIASKSQVLSRTAASEAIWMEHMKRVYRLDGAAACAGLDGTQYPGRPDKAFVTWQEATIELGLRTHDHPLCPDAPVLIRGLKGASELNGLQGSCKEFDVMKSRWQVELPGSSEPFKLIRPQNLKVIGAASFDPLPHSRWLAVWSKLRYKVASLQPRLSEETQRSFLKPGASEEDVRGHFQQLGIESASPMVTDMWRCFDGQDAPLDRQLAREIGSRSLRSPVDPDSYVGLFGGYSAYDHEVSTRLFSLKHVSSFTQFLWDRVKELKEQHPNKVVFATSHNACKIFLVDVVDGSVAIWTRRPGEDLEYAAPRRSDEFGLLTWVEEYTRRLCDDVYEIMPIRPEVDESLGICLFPASGPTVSRRVTNGVEVKASCIYMPEHPQGWTYSITFALVGTKEERGYDTCQLDKRHWEIQEGDNEPQHVRGDGVIGFFPILTDGGWILNEQSDPHGQYQKPPGTIPGPFRYQSCSGRSRSMRGKFGGDITFIPGTKRRPTGQAFMVYLESFDLCVPDFMF